MCKKRFWERFRHTKMTESSSGTGENDPVSGICETVFDGTVYGNTLTDNVSGNA